MYQRGKIQEESMYYSEFEQGRKKHDGSLPLIGVNTFLPKEHAGDIVTTIELIRSTEEEKNQQIANVEAFKASRNGFVASPAGGRGRAEGAGEGGARASGETSNLPGSLALLQQAARDRKNVFEQLMEAVKYNSEGRSVMPFMMWVGSIGGICNYARL